MSGAMSVEMILRLVDQMSGPLRGVVSEVKELDRATKDLGRGAGAPGGRKAADWLAEQQRIKATTNELGAYEKQLRSVHAAQSAVVDAAIARELGRGSMSLLHHGAEAGAEGMHSEISLETQGNTAEQIREIQDKAAELSRQFKAFDKTKIETMLGGAKTFVGSLEHAMAAMPDLLRLRTIQQGQHGTTSDEEFNSLTKALEVGGVAADEKKLHERLETFAKIMNVFKETIHPGDFTSFYNQAGIAARTLSDNFMRGAGAHIMQEMGGGGAGNAVNMFMNALEAGTMQPKAMETMDKLGLLDPKKVRKKGNGEIRWIDPGGVKGSDLARTDPDLWIDKVLRPALEKLAPEKRDEAELALFSNSSVRKLVDKILNQKSVVDKDRAQVEAAPGLEAADTWIKKDPTLAAHAAGAQFENLMRDAGKGLSGAATGVLNWMAEAEAGLSSVAKDHPISATVAGLSAAAAGFWASLKLAQQAMMKAGSWFGQGAGAGGAEGGAGASTESVLRSAERGASASGGETAPNASAMDNYRATVKGLAENGGKAEGLEGLAGRAFSNAHPDAQARMLDAAKSAMREGPATAAPKGAISESAIWESLGGAETALGMAARVGKIIRGGIIGGVVGAAGDYALEKGEQKLLGWTPENTAAARAQIEEKAHQYWRSKGINMPWWNQPEGPQQQAQPKVDTSQIDAAQQKAQAAGEAIKTNLDVTANPQADTTQIEAAGTKATEAGAAIDKLNVAVRPQVDASSIDAAARKVDDLLHKLKQVGTEAKGAGASAHWARARLGAAPSSGSLHDGPEAH